MTTLETLWVLLWALYLMESYDYAPKGEAVLVEGLTGFQRAKGRLSFKHAFPGQRLFAFSTPAENWNTDTLRARVEEFDKATRWLRAFSQVLFIVLFIVMPTLYLRLDTHPYNFIAGIASCLLLWWGASASLYYADRRLNRGVGIPRLQRLLHALIAPGFALRATEALSRDLLKGWHPLAAAAVLMKRADFEALCQMVWLDETWRAQASPRLAEIWLLGGLPADARDTWFKRQGVDILKLTSPPKAAEAESRSYCPRCLAQFTLEQGVCSDCSLPLKHL